MQQIADWLQKLGLGKYAQFFAENEIDVSVLPHLTDQDLKDIGVPLGPRRKILAAIAAEAETTDATLEPATSTEPKPHDTAERRQVTVMFSDLVGSTALSARMDPEDLREIISSYQKCVAESVQRFGGFVAKYMGDGVLIYFGYPQAHEDDAERAVRAGLDLVPAVGALKTHASLQTRVGIATGLVVVGDLIGSGASQEQAIVGETPNLAARLQGVAEPNSVVIAESTRRLVGSLFEFEDLGAHNLKGLEGPVQAWAALRSSSVESRFEAFHATGLPALVGREEELELLLRRWSKAKGGQGQVVLLSGEPGIGKSRLSAALLERLAAEPHTRLRYFCSPQHTDSALYPFISQIERAAGFVHVDTTEAKLDKLDNLLAQSFTSRQDPAPFVEMLSLMNGRRYPTKELAPEQRRQKTLEALTLQLEALAKGNPVLMIFEDVHWIDPTSLEVLGRTVDRLRTLGVLLIVTYRPEFEPLWIGRPYVTALSLNRLDEREIAGMIDRVIGNKALPETIRQEIIERTDGIPLFVEEMTRAVLEAETENEARKTAATVPSSALAIPASLHASLMARLDRLGPAKEVAQIGAAIGREFSHPILAAVVSKPETALQSSLDRLVKAGLLFRQGMPPHVTYLFKHALVQDVAYGTLLRDPRRALHARIAEILEGGFADVATNQPELLARHYSEAGLIAKAASFWGKAGRRSLERSALVEAAEQFARALEQTEALPPTSSLRREQIKLQVALVSTLFHVKGPAALETKAAAEKARLLIEQAEALGEPPEDPLLLSSVLYSFFVANYVAFKGDTLRELAVQFLSLAEKQGATVPLMVGHRIMGSALACTGSPIQAREHYDRALSMYDPALHRAFAMRFTTDIRAAILFFRSWTAWLLGYPDAALADVGQALTDAQDLGHASTTMGTLNNVILTLTLCGDYAGADEKASQLTTLAHEKGPYWKSAGGMAHGCVLALTGNASDAIQILTSAIATFRATGSTWSLPFRLACLAKAQAELGQFEDAWRRLDEAMMMVEVSKEVWSHPEILRLGGEIALMSPERDAAKAEAYFERALSVARHQQAKSWELRAAMSLARLLRDQGKVQQARELLAPTYGWFTEGFDTRDLKEAKALLEELAS
jgi:class 3 adenylate cyclase/predicted ATPase